MNRLNKFKKEDGSLDVKQIAELPIKERMRIIRSLDIKQIVELPFEERMRFIDDLTDEQFHQYVALFPENDGTQQTIPIIVNYSMEDEIRRGTGVDIDEYLKRKRKEFGLE